jgi:hypothetical protein
MRVTVPLVELLRIDGTKTGESERICDAYGRIRKAEDFLDTVR